MPSPLPVVASHGVIKLPNGDTDATEGEPFSQQDADGAIELARWHQHLELTVLGKPQK
jgi:hypothetical protein